jgi:hypothetical protein
MQRQFYIASSIKGSTIYNVKSCILIQCPKVDKFEIPKEYTDFSNPSIARSLAIPYYITKFPEADISNQSVVYYFGYEPAEYVSLITLEFLNQLVDADENSLPLVAFILKTLKIDIKLLKYRGGSALLPPAIMPISLLKTNNYLDGWCNLHGYVFYGSQDNFCIYRKETPNDSLVDHLIFNVILNSKITKSGGIVSNSSIKSVQNLRNDLGLNDTIPLFLIYQDIQNFHLQWEECRKLGKRIYPTIQRYFNLEDSDHFGYPRLIPFEGKFNDSVPCLEPGPCIYSWKSAPHICHRYMMSVNDEGCDVLCIAEGTHQERAVDCQVSPMRLS